MYAKCCDKVTINAETEYLLKTGKNLCNTKS